MQNFVFRYRALLKHRLNRRDQCRQLLAQLLADDVRLVAQATAIEENRLSQLGELRHLVEAGGVDVDRAISRRYHAGQLGVGRMLVERNRGLLSQQLELCRQALLKFDRDVRVLEKLEEKQRAEFLYEQDRRSIRELDDAWLATHTKEFSR